MATCRACGGDIQWVASGDGAGKVPLDTHEVRTGHRFHVTEGKLVEIVDSSGATGFSDHRETCPYGQLNPRRSG